MEKDKEAVGRILGDLGSKVFDDIQPDLQRGMELANMVWPSGAQTVLTIVAQRLLTMHAVMIVAQESGREDPYATVDRAMEPDSILFAALVLAYQPESCGLDPIGWAHDAFVKLRGHQFANASGAYVLGSGVPVHVVGAL
jgi:hypothetical protein